MTAPTPYSYMLEYYVVSRDFIEWRDDRLRLTFTTREGTVSFSTPGTLFDHLGALVALWEVEVATERTRYGRTGDTVAYGRCRYPLRRE